MSDSKIDFNRWYNNGITKALRRVTIKYLLLGLLFSFPTLLYASANFVGTYKCTGYDPYLNKAYAGTVIVSPQNTVYKVEMNYDTGEKYIATGGQYDPTLMSVVFQNA